MGLALVRSTLMDEGGEARERGRLHAADLAEFGHAQHQGTRGALGDAGNAEHQIEALREIGVRAQFGREALEFRRPALLKTLDVSCNDAQQPLVADVFEAGLEADDVFLDLFDEREAVGERFEARIGRRLEHVLTELNLGVPARRFF